MKPYENILYPSNSNNSTPPKQKSKSDITLFVTFLTITVILFACILGFSLTPVSTHFSYERNQMVQGIKTSTTQTISFSKRGMMYKMDVDYRNRKTNSLISETYYLDKAEMKNEIKKGNINAFVYFNTNDNVLSNQCLNRGNIILVSSLGLLFLVFFFSTIFAGVIAKKNFEKKTYL